MQLLIGQRRRIIRSPNTSLAVGIRLDVLNFNLDDTVSVRVVDSGREITLNRGWLERNSQVLIEEVREG